MPLRLGILIVGSLFWEQDRQAWRNERLQMEGAVSVRAPIRYGRISENWGSCYTMVFSRGCAPGQAKAVPCRNDVSTAHDVAAEAERLWAAERRKPPDGNISAGWGCVALMTNPQSAMPAELLAGWAVRVRQARPYGRVPQMPEEGELVSTDGILQIPWPSDVEGFPLPFDLLLATATYPKPSGDPHTYPTPMMIAARWRADAENHVRYFRNNVRDGIRTFEDAAISAALDAPA